MVERVLPAPVVVGSEGEHSGDEAGDVIGETGLEEGAVPQSWKIIKTRTSRPPARTARPNVSHQEMPSVQYIRHQSKA